MQDQAGYCALVLSSAFHFLFASLLTSLMFKTSALAIMFFVLIAPLSLEAATPVFKCANKGSVTYQSVPCPTGERRDAPTVAQLNADRQKKLSQGGVKPQSSPSAAPGGEKERPQVAVTPTASPINSFKCDGRLHCSQMTSCSEAKNFLSHCPGVKMDGDGDGIPCEDQFCSK